MTKQLEEKIEGLETELSMLIGEIRESTSLNRLKNLAKLNFPEEWGR